MTDEELAERRERLRKEQRVYTIDKRGFRSPKMWIRRETTEPAFSASEYRNDALLLLAEVERLRAELEREHEDRLREYEYANVDAELASKRNRQLMRENAAMREIVQAVAHGDGRGCLCTDEPVFESIGEDVFRFAGVKHPHIHAPDCPVTKARAWLAAQETTKQTKGGTAG